VPHFGYWKDLMAILARSPPGPVAERCLSLMCDQLEEDGAELTAANAEKRTPKLSLIGKYAPREGSAFDKASLKLANKLASRLFGANGAQAARKYRKLVASLNASLNTTEVLMAANRWSEIRFSGVASLCLQRHRKAFLNEALTGRVAPQDELTGNRHPEDPTRVAARAHLREALAAKKGVKGKQLMPQEIASKCMHRHKRNLSTLEADLLDAQWASMRDGVVESMKAAAEARQTAVLDAVAPQAATGLASVGTLAAALPKHVDLGKMVALVDVSASMDGTPMEVAIALGILVSELTHDAFKHRLLTFESRPSWVDLTHCGSIREKVEKVQSAPWGGSTDFAAACERILAAAETAKLKPDEIPDLIVFSDMQFDQAGGRCYGYGSWETHFERLQRRFAEVGRHVCGEPYAAPRIVFWNLRASIGFPVAKDAPNTQMLSGFSPALLKLVVSAADLTGEEEEVTQPDGSVKVVRSGPTPMQTMRAALDDAAFDSVRAKLAAVEVGPLAAYAFEQEEAGFSLVAVEAGGGPTAKEGVTELAKMVAEEADPEDFALVDVA